MILLNSSAPLKVRQACPLILTIVTKQVVTGASVSPIVSYEVLILYTRPLVSPSIQNYFLNILEISKPTPDMFVHI